MTLHSIASEVDPCTPRDLEITTSPTSVALLVCSIAVASPSHHQHPLYIVISEPLGSIYRLCKFLNIFYTNQRAPSTMFLKSFPLSRPSVDAFAMSIQEKRAI